MHEIDRADRGDAGQHVVDVLGRPLARPDAGNEAAVLLQLVGGVLRIEDDGRVEEGEEDDHRAVEQHVERLPVAEQRRHRRQPARPAAGGEVGDRDRQKQQRRGEDRRNDARGVELQRQVRGIALEHAIADLPLRILDQQPALRPLDEDDGGHDDDRQHADAEDDRRWRARPGGRAPACRPWRTGCWRRCRRR